MHFDYLRDVSWDPTFSWVKTSLEAAHQINSFHEDYPKYVEATNVVLNVLANAGLRNLIPSPYLKLIHGFIFSDKPFMAKWREVDVRVGIHLPPKYASVHSWMDKLEMMYVTLSVERLIEWYKDFETIHPFQDGNGRVGGIIVAGYAHNLHPGCGWLTVGQ